MSTLSTRKEDVRREWFLVDASGQTLGRLATRLAIILRGKHKVTYTPHIDTGDFVVVVNAGKVRLTGSKEQKKLYQRHTSWPGGIITRTAAQLRAEKPTEMVRLAVKGMLPRGPLGRAMFKKLKIYATADHPHLAQQPKQAVL